MQSKTVQLDLFKKVYRIRRVENKIASLYPEQEMRCPSRGRTTGAYRSAFSDRRDL